MRVRGSLAGLVVLGCIMLYKLPGVVVARAQQADPRVLFAAPAADRVIALTIDDGPSAATDRILDVLDEFDARATFFLIGENAQRRPDAVRRIVEAGHEVAHHMMTDEPSIRLAEPRFRADFARMAAILAEFNGAKWFRPGSGWYDRSMVDFAERNGYRVVLGSVYPFDAHIGVARILSATVLANVAPGAIVILHDGERRGLRTARVLRTVLAELRRRGYRVTTVTELVRAAPPDERDDRP